MKSTGITRKIDELGRIVIPKEIRRNLSIRDGESLEIYIEDEGILLKKHSEIKNIEEIGSKLCNIIGSLLDLEMIITDREKVIAVSKNKELLNKEINKELINLIDNREIKKSDYETKLIINDIEITGYFNIAPIISSIDSLGLVIIVSKSINNYMDIAKFVSRIMADKIDIG